MILTDLYVMAFGVAGKAKNRFDCVASTGEYEPFEDIARHTRDKIKHLIFYLGDAEHVKAKPERKAQRAITKGRNHITSIFVPDLAQPNTGYGDVKGTQDALLFLLGKDEREMEVFVARGLKANKYDLWVELTDGELDEDVEALRKRVKPTGI